MTPVTPLKGLRCSIVSWFQLSYRRSVGVIYVHIDPSSALIFKWLLLSTFPLRDIAGRFLKVLSDVVTQSEKHLIRSYLKDAEGRAVLLVDLVLSYITVCTRAGMGTPCDDSGIPQRADFRNYLILQHSKVMLLFDNSSDAHELESVLWQEKL